MDYSNKFVQIILYIWQLPQNILGLVYKLILSKEKCILQHEDIRFYIAPTIRNSVSLGRYVFISERSSINEGTYDHEYGHCRQSRYLGPFYLPTVGLFSGLHCLFFDVYSLKSYYDYWTERWANKLGGVPSYNGSGCEDGLIHFTYIQIKERLKDLFD